MLFGPGGVADGIASGALVVDCSTVPGGHRRAGCASGVAGCRNGRCPRFRARSASRRRRSPPASRPRGTTTTASPSSHSWIRAGTVRVVGVAQHLGGELGVHGVHVVAQRRPRHRLPAVVARQRQDPLYVVYAGTSTYCWTGCSTT